MISWSKLLSNLYVQRMVFSLLGINLTALPQASIVNRPWLLIILFFSTTYQLTCVLVYLLVTEQTIAEAMWTIAPWLQFMLTSLKLLTFLYKRRELVQLIADVNGLLDGEIVSSKARTIWLRENRRAQAYCFAFASITSGSAFSFLMMPIIFGLISLVKTGEFTPIAVMKTTTPYDQTKPIFFTLDYLFLVANVFMSVTSTIGVDTLFLWHVTNISSHFRIVTQQLEELAEVFGNINCNFFSWELNRNNILLHRFEESLKGTLHYHKTTLHLAIRFAENFRVLILWEVSISCLYLSSIICQYALTENLGYYFFFLCTFVTFAFAQLMIYCFGSEKLNNESELIATALYDRLPWYQMPVRLQKLLLILPLQRAQEEMFLTGYVFKLERPLLVSIVRAAFSLVTLIKAVQQRQLEAQ